MDRVTERWLDYIRLIMAENHIHVKWKIIISKLKREPCELLGAQRNLRNDTLKLLTGSRYPLDTLSIH